MGVGGDRLGVVTLMLASIGQHISLWKGDLPRPSPEDMGDVRPPEGLGSEEVTSTEGARISGLAS